MTFNIIVKYQNGSSVIFDECNSRDSAEYAFNAAVRLSDKNNEFIKKFGKDLPQSEYTVKEVFIEEIA